MGGWWDFGTGSAGGHGCHAFAHIAKVLKLGQPTAVHASSSKLFKETAPAASIVHWDFPARGQMPAVRVTWYDGGLKPARPAGLEDGRNLGNEGLMWIGDEGTILGDLTGGGSRLIPEKRMRDFRPPEKTLPRSIGHYKEWCQACKGGAGGGCNFAFAGPLDAGCFIGQYCGAAAAPAAVGRRRCGLRTTKRPMPCWMNRIDGGHCEVCG